MTKIFDRLFFTGPMSLGDAFIMNGVAHYYGDMTEELHIPCLPKYYDTIRTLYQDHPHIIVVPLMPHDQGEDQYVAENKLSRILRNSVHSVYLANQLIPVGFDMQYYDYYSIPFSMRYTNFRLPTHVDGSDELYDQLSGGEPYVLVHNKTGHHPDGINLNLDWFRQANGLPPIKLVYVEENLDGRNLLRWVKLIKNASEIHCVSSSFWALVDSMFNQTNAKLFFHDIRAFSVTRVNSEWNRRCWNIVNYQNKI